MAGHTGCGINSLPINPLCVYILDKWGDWNNQGSAIGVISWHRESQLLTCPVVSLPVIRLIGEVMLHHISSSWAVLAAVQISCCLCEA